MLGDKTLKSFGNYFIVQLLGMHEWTGTHRTCTNNKISIYTNKYIIHHYIFDNMKGDLIRMEHTRVEWWDHILRLVLALYGINGSIHLHVARGCMTITPVVVCCNSLSSRLVRSSKFGNYFIVQLLGMHEWMGTYDTCARNKICNYTNNYITHHHTFNNMKRDLVRMEHTRIEWWDHILWPVLSYLLRN